MADHELDSLEKRLDFIESLVFGNSEKDAFYPRVSIFMPKYPLAFKSESNTYFLIYEIGLLIRLVKLSIWP